MTFREILFSAVVVALCAFFYGMGYQDSLSDVTAAIERVALQ